MEDQIIEPITPEDHLLGQAVQILDDPSVYYIQHIFGDNVSLIKIDEDGHTEFGQSPINLLTFI